MKEQFDNKLIYNITISYRGRNAILYTRLIINSLINMAITFISVVTLIFLTGMQYSIMNYFYLVCYYLIAIWFMYGIGVIYACICKFFDLEKMVAMFF